MEFTQQTQDLEPLGPQLQNLTITGPVNAPSSTPTVTMADSSNECQTQGLPHLQPTEELTAIPDENTPGIFEPAPGFDAEPWRRHVQAALDRAVQNPRYNIFDRLIEKVVAEWALKTGIPNVEPHNITQEYVDAEDVIEAEMAAEAMVEDASDMEMEDDVDHDIKMEGSSD